MGGVDREGEGTKGGSGVVGGGQQPAAQFTVAVNGGGGGGGGGSGPVDKVKFTVSVRGHQWSSARHVNETLQEFATAIQRNARRLEFIEEDDSIQRLQLAYGDGSEPEDLDVDATLGDVIICMGGKQLVAIVNSTKAPPASNGRPDIEKLGPESPVGLVGVQRPKRDLGTAPNNYSVPLNSGAPYTNGISKESATVGPKFLLPDHYKPACRTGHSKSTSEPSTQGLKIAIPSQADPASLPFQEERSYSFHPDYAFERLAGSLPPLGPSRANSMNGKLVMCGGKDTQGLSSAQYCPNPSPSPAELAQMLVRSSSHPHPRMQQPCSFGGSGAPIPTGPGVAQCNRTATSTVPNANGGFQSFASGLLSRLPMMPNNNMHCSHGATTNIALLAQFLASQLRAFVPVEGGAHPSADATHLSPGRENKSALPGKDANAYNIIPPPTASNGQMTKENYPEAVRTVVENGSPKVDAGNMKLSGSGSHDKDESSSSANVNTTVAPSSDGVDSEHPNDRSEVIFLVNRRSKRGVGTHHLKISDLSVYFHLSVVEAAKKLGVSQTTLKKACRKFGLKRWPGRKVRSLESTIHGLEHTIAVGQGAGLEELTEAYMRSEVSKLQQERDQLVHGTPAQHSPAVRTADLYKRLYSRGWRSKYHCPGRHDLDLSNANHENRTSGLTQPAKKATEMTKEADPACKGPGGGQTNQQQAGCKTPKLVPCKEETQSQQSQTTCAHCKDPVMREMDSGDLIRESNIEAHEEPSAPANMAVDNGTVVNGTNTTGENPSCPEREVIIEEKDITIPERSPKRPKRECRTAAEGAVRQGLRSSTCAM